ncbi:MAG: hypothetical protein IPM13_07990 [Phycisphaerales bacterium]|nr:hypothetical protein [Phycisphaerales bacterium]
MRSQHAARLGLHAFEDRNDVAGLGQRAGKRHQDDEGEGHKQQHTVHKWPPEGGVDHRSSRTECHRRARTRRHRWPGRRRPLLDCFSRTMRFSAAWRPQRRLQFPIRARLPHSTRRRLKRKQYLENPEPKQRAQLGLVLSRLVRDGKVSAPTVIGRNHLDCGSVASPKRAAPESRVGLPRPTKR